MALAPCKVKPAHQASFFLPESRYDEWVRGCRSFTFRNPLNEERAGNISLSLDRRGASGMPSFETVIPSSPFPRFFVPSRTRFSKSRATSGSLRFSVRDLSKKEGVLPFYPCLLPPFFFSLKCAGFCVFVQGFGWPATIITAYPLVFLPLPNFSIP